MTSLMEAQAHLTFSTMTLQNGSVMTKEILLRYIKI